MFDKLFIRELKVSCIIGTLPRERVRKQPVVIDLEFPAPVRKAAAKDDLRLAPNYKKISDRTAEFVSKSRFFLIETLAERLADILLKEFRLGRLTLRVSKPRAIRNAKTVGVEIRRP